MVDFGAVNLTYEATIVKQHPRQVDTTKAENAAKSFNTYMFEKMLNNSTDMRAERSSISRYQQQSEYLLNAQLAEKISENSASLNLKIARELMR